MPAWLALYVEHTINRARVDNILSLLRHYPFLRLEKSGCPIKVDVN